MLSKEYPVLVAKKLFKKKKLSEFDLFKIEAEEQEQSKDKESVLSHIKFDLESDNENEEDDDVMTVKRRHVFGKEDPSEGIHMFIYPCITYYLAWVSNIQGRY